MPKRRERALLYIRESDISLALDSITVESAKQALLEHAQQKGYDVSPEDIHIETISAYHTYYFDREELMKALKKVERHEVDVFLVTEVRALSRKGAGETLVIYNILQKADVRLETLAEVITDDPLGEMILTYRATYARYEREQAYIRMQRGKKDRVEIGNAPPNGRRAYGFVLVDTEKETKAEYRFNTAVIYVDPTGEEWSEVKVRKFILDRLYTGGTLRGVARYLNDLGIPAPRKPRKREQGCWSAPTIRNIAAETINYGVVYVNKWKEVKDKQGNSKQVKRPPEEWIRLNTVVPALITKEDHAIIMRNLRNNRKESLRNNHHPEELGLLRGGYIFCGICGQRMSVKYPSSHGRNSKNEQLLSSPTYRCHQNNGKSLGIVHQHLTTIGLKTIDTIAKGKIAEALLHPEQVRQTVEEIRKKNVAVVSQEEIEKTIAGIRQKMQNLYKLAENATDDETIAHLGTRMNELERQKRETEKLLYVLKDDAEERAAIEEEVCKFEMWAAQVQPFLSDRAYLDKAFYEELRLAIKILGLRVTVYPLNGDYPFRWKVEMTVPAVYEKINIMSLDSH